MNLKIFQLHGPFDVPLKQAKKHHYIPLDCPKFWEQDATHVKGKGCYIFGFRAAKGFRPVYVGRTKKGFRKEVFTPHKISQHYAPALADTVKGTPVVFFVVAPSGRGRPNNKMIKDLETFLIQVGVAKNPNLSNIQNRQEAKWGIKGVIRGGKGKTSAGARKFKKMMGI
jgi:hypothetical protein